MKEHMHESPVDAKMDIVARIVDNTVIFCDMPRVYENHRRSVQQHCESCVRVNGCNFEPLNLYFTLLE